MQRIVSTATRAALQTVNWPAVGCFYALACAISYLLRNAPNPTEGWLPRPGLFTFGLGPIGAALLCRRFFPSVPMTVSVLGTSPGQTLLFVGWPLWLGCLFGVANKRGIDPHLFGGLFALSAVLYRFVEEMGWRGFLHSALRPLPTAWRVGITALLWLGWHLTFMPDLSSVVAGPKNSLWMLLGLFVLGSWGLGSAAERTRSVLVAGGLHDFMDLTRSPVALGVMAVGWAWMLWRWHQNLLPRVLVKTTRMGLSIGLVLASLATFAQPSAPLPKQEIDLQKDTPDFSLFDKAFYDNQLFLLGETHGFKNAQLVDLALLKHLNQRIGVRYYIAEVDPTKAYYINQYLQTGQDSTLRLVFASWIANRAQWANQDFFRKIQAIRGYNQTIPAKKRIRFVGVDEVQDRSLVARQLTELTDNQLVKLAGSRLDSLVTLLRATPEKPDTLAAQVALNWLAQLKNHPADYRSIPADTRTELSATLQTLAYRKTIRGREKTIFATFRDALSRFNLTNEKLYGFWGGAHVWQAPLNDGRLKFAGMIQASDLPMKGKTVSIACSYVDSFMMLPTQYLPPFWQDKGKVYSRVDKFNDNGPMMTISGTDELIKQSQPNTITLFKLVDTAAGKKPITATYSPFMPKEQQLNFDPNRPTTDYFQYIVLIRNSDMTEPF